MKNQVPLSPKDKNKKLKSSAATFARRFKG